MLHAWDIYKYMQVFGGELMKRIFIRKVTSHFWYFFLNILIRATFFLGRKFSFEVYLLVDEKVYWI